MTLTELAASLEALRHSKKLSVSELCRRAKVSRKTWYAGRKNPGGMNFTIFCAFLRALGHDLIIEVKEKK